MVKKLHFQDAFIGTGDPTMINGIGVLGWGVGGIEAEAGSVGRSCRCRGYPYHHNSLPQGATATDLALELITRRLVKKVLLVNFVRSILVQVQTLPLADRATIANMAPEYWSDLNIPLMMNILQYYEVNWSIKRTYRANKY